MRGRYEAYILVKTKDGKEFVCGMNLLPKPTKTFQQFTEEEKKRFLETYCLWN